MVSDGARNHVWSLVLDLERLARYYNKLASGLARKHRLGTAVIAFAATSAVVSLLQLFPPQVELVANAVIAILACWMLVNNFSQKLIVARGVGERCRELETDARALWLSLETLDDAEARRKWEDLCKEMNRVTSKPESAGILNNDALNEECAAEAYDVIKQEFAI